MSAIDENIAARISGIQVEKNVLAVVGTIDPKISGLNFIPYNKEILRNLELYLSQPGGRRGKAADRRGLDSL